jgi:hypothetical protein
MEDLPEAKRRALEKEL